MQKQTIVKDDGRYLIYYTFGEEDAAFTPVGSPKIGIRVPAADSSLASREASEDMVADTPLPKTVEGTWVRAAEEPGTGQEPEA